MSIDPNLRPRLKPGCRVRNAPAQEPILLMPETALRLRGSALRIVELCDGNHTLAEIVTALRAEFSEAAMLASDVEQFVSRLRDRGAVELV
jgi:pyrroloquinoline quinone biosynthesis protein D